MKFRVRSLTTGKKYKCEKHEKFHLMADGQLISYYKEESEYGYYQTSERTAQANE